MELNIETDFVPSNAVEAYLLALVREQAAKMAAAKGLVSTWGEHPSSPEGLCAFELRIALGLNA